MCQECVAEIGVAFAYRQKCERSDATLREMFQQQFSNDLVKLERHDEAIVCNEADIGRTDEHWFEVIDTNIVVSEIDLKTEDARSCAEIEETKSQMDFETTSAHSFDGEMAAASDGGTDVFDEMLGEHERTDASSERKYKCEICSKVFNRKYNWKQHQLVHSDKKNFQCPKCDQEYKSKNNLK